MRAFTHEKVTIPKTSKASKKQEIILFSTYVYAKKD